MSESVNDALRLIARAREHLKIAHDEIEPEQAIADALLLLDEAVEKLVK